MRRDSVVAVTRRVLDQIEAGGPEACGSARSEPGSVFVDRDRFLAERAMMRRVPHVVGWVAEVAHPGDFTTKDVAGVPVLVVRDGDGVLRAFLNACAHRGSQVATGCGSTARFTCPYHSWSYRPDGRLVGVPARDMFADVDLADIGLRPLPVSERSGLISVGLDPAVDPAPLLDGVVDELAGFAFDSYAPFESRTFAVAANWKLAVDVNFEGYHFSALHRASLNEMATNHSAFDTFGPHCRWVFPFRGIEALAGKAEEDWPDVFDGTVVYGLFPSCVLIEAAGISQILRVYPGREPGESIVTLSAAAHVAFPQERRDDLVAGYEIAYDLLRGEDFPAAESCQRGFAGGLERMVIGRNEPLIQHLHAAWDSAVDHDVDPSSVVISVPELEPVRPGVARPWS